RRAPVGHRRRLRHARQAALRPSRHDLRPHRAGGGRGVARHPDPSLATTPTRNPFEKNPFGKPLRERGETMLRTRHSGRGLRAAAAAVALAMAVTACSSNTSDSSGDNAADTPRRGGTITIDWVSNPTSLDPLKYNVFGSFNVYSLDRKST